LYSDIKYVSALVAPATVNTLPPETLSAFREQGEAVLAIEQAVDRAPDVMQALDQLGIDMAIIDTALEQEGIEKFVKPYLSLLETFKSLLQ
jgi:transaldolase